MNQPPRLREGRPTALERELLEAGASYRSSATTRRATLAALGLAATASMSAGAAVAASSSLVEKIGIAKLVAVLGAGAAVAVPAAYFGWQAFTEPAPQVVAVAPVRPAPAAARVVVDAIPAPVPEEQVEPAPAAPDAPQVRKDARATAAGALSAELAKLDVARSKLAAGDAKGALAELDEYARAFPRGRLDLEAEVLRIDALGRSGDAEGAKKRAEAFLKRHPKSVLASRVRRYLEDAR